MRAIGVETDLGAGSGAEGMGDIRLMARSILPGGRIHVTMVVGGERTGRWPIRAVGIFFRSPGRQMSLTGSCGRWPRPRAIAADTQSPRARPSKSAAPGAEAARPRLYRG